jgi:glucan phosphoethanolaminetransferase (alkaline phosphatase superfamily)
MVVKISFGGSIQIAGLIICAAIAPGSPGGPFFSAFIIIFALVLCYAYDGYKQYKLAKVLASAIVVLVLMLFALSKYDQPVLEWFYRSMGWSAFIYVFCYSLWVIFEDMDRRFHSHREKELLNLNKQLIELNHEILDARCNDAP